MLTQIYVRDFAIVDQLELDFQHGFTVLTGETGAGKSIIIDALNLSLGSRADSSAIREGRDKAEVTATFDIKDNAAASRWLRDNDLDDGDVCLLRRIIVRGKSGKAYINGRPVTVQTLSQLGRYLVDIHGQHEHQSLTQTETQRQIVDGFANLTADVTKLGELYEAYKQVDDAINNAEQAAAERSAEIDLLRFQSGELEQTAPEDGEFTQLADEAKRLNHAQDIRQGLGAAIEALHSAEASAGELIRSHAARVSALSEHDSALAPAVPLLDTALVHLEEAADILRTQLDLISDDPERLSIIDARMNVLNQLARKHRVSEDDLGTLRADLCAKLGAVEAADVDADTLIARRETLRGDYMKLARKVSRARKRAANKLSESTTDIMQQLGMPGGRFLAALDTDPERVNRNGFERISFQVAANPGQTPSPLAKVASGGELARISLAIDVVTTAVRRVSTLVFDEVDTGIGGGIAEVVGHQLRALGDSRQVLCVTHLAQVAAQASHQLRVVKQTEDAVQVGIVLLDKKHRVEEIARMLGGIDITKQTRAHAREMLNRAAM